MAVALNVFQAGEKAIAQEVNDNFSMLQEEITTSIDGIKSDVQSSFTEAKEQILGDIEVVNNSKLNLNLDNVKDDGKANIIGFVMPDYTAGVTKEIGKEHTAECAGIIVLSVSGTGGANVDVEMYVDNVLINESDSWMRDAGQGWSCWGLVPKEATFKVISDFKGTLTFYPMKGAN